MERRFKNLWVFDASMKKRFLALVLSLGVFATALTGCSNNSNSTTSSNVIEYGDVTDDSSEKDNKEEIENEANMKLPSYSEHDLPSSIIRGTAEGEIDYTSYYYTQLETRLKIVYDQLVMAAKDFQPEVALTKQITPEELQLIFNMLYLDTPNLMQLDSSYSYMVNNEGYIYFVGLEYCMNQAEYNELYGRLSEHRDSLRAADTDYTAEQNAIGVLLGTEYSQNDYENGSFSETTEQFSSVFIYEKGNSIGISRALNYLFRTAGLESCVTTGEIISNSFYDGEGYELFTENQELNNNDDDFFYEEDEFDNENTSNSNTTSIYAALPTLDMKFSDVTNDGNIYYVDNHYSTTWAWNLVKIDNSWYNVDIAYSKLLNTAYGKTMSVSELTSNAFNNVPDLTMSQTRIWHENEEMLGITPNCNSYGFQYSYRNMSYLLPHNELQTLKRISETLDILCGLSQITTEDEEEMGVIDYVTYQFSDENTFNYFINNFEDEVENYNKLNSNILQSYSLYYNRDALIVSIYDVVLE